MVQPLGGALARESAQTTNLAASAAGRASFSYSRRKVGSFRVFRLRRIRRQSGGLSPRRRQAGSSGPRSFRRLRHQRHVAGDRGRLHICARQIGLACQIKLRRSAFDPTKQPVFDRIKADRVQTQGILDCPVQDIEAKGLEQAQNLHIPSYAPS